MGLLHVPIEAVPGDNLLAGLAADQAGHVQAVREQLHLRPTWHRHGRRRILRQLRLEDTGVGCHGKRGNADLFPGRILILSCLILAVLFFRQCALFFLRVGLRFAGL